MKHYFWLLSLLILTACSNNDNLNNCHEYFRFGVNASINLNLPQYSQLQFTSNSVYIANQGVGGIILINVGSGLRAWDAADPKYVVDPNFAPSNCFIMEIVGTNAKCSCTGANEYSLFTGGSLGVQLPCGLKEYRVSSTGNNSYNISN